MKPTNQESEVTNMPPTDKLIKQIYTNSFKSDPTDPTNRLIIIATKVLDNRSGGPVTYDVDRLYDELVYFNHYSHKGQTCPIEVFLPIILANRSYDAYEAILMSLADKMTRFYGCPDRLDDYILEVYSLDALIRAYLRSATSISIGQDLVDTLRDIKDRLVAYNPPKNSKKEIVNFQVKKIKYIGKLHSQIDLASNDPDSNIGELLPGESLSWLENINKYFKETEDSEDRISSPENAKRTRSSFVYSMADYLTNIRNRQVITKKYMGKSSPKHFLQEPEGYEGRDPVLNSYRVVRKIRNGNRYVVSLDTKSGAYDMVYVLKVF